MWAGNLLFNNAAYEDAIKAYSHSESIEKNEYLLIERAKCKIILKKYDAALADINKVKQIKHILFQTYL